MAEQFRVGQGQLVVIQLAIGLHHFSSALGDSRSLTAFSKATLNWSSLSRSRDSPAAMA